LHLDEIHRGRFEARHAMARDSVPLGIGGRRTQHWSKRSAEGFGERAQQLFFREYWLGRNVFAPPVPSHALRANPRRMISGPACVARLMDRCKKLISFPNLLPDHFHKQGESFLTAVHGCKPPSRLLQSRGALVGLRNTVYR